MKRWMAGLGLGLAFAGGLMGLLTLVVRPWYQRWGASDVEWKMSLPGDELLPEYDVQSTRAITILAPAEAVWPWLVQLGQERGGFYSYDILENLFGCEIHNADRIVPEWQTVQVGDLVHMFPKEKFGPTPYMVAQVEPGLTLVLGHKSETGQNWNDTWQFVLLPVDAGTTRLVIRTRALSAGVFDALDFIPFIMERAMLLGIKERVER